MGLFPCPALGPTAALARSQRLQAAAAAATAEHLHIVSKESRRNVVRGVNTLDQVEYLHVANKENLHIADHAHRHFPDSSYGNCIGPDALGPPPGDTLRN